MKNVLVFLADGFEEIEGLTAVDVLRRAGAAVSMVSVMGRLEINGSHGIVLKADELFEDADLDAADMVVLPGGLPGTYTLRDHEGLTKLLTERYKAGRGIAAICAAPSVFAGLGFLKGRKACCYPSFEQMLSDSGADVQQVPAVTDGHVTTGRGMGAAIPFALEIVKILYGAEKAESLAERIVYFD